MDIIKQIVREVTEEEVKKAFCAYEEFIERLARTELYLSKSLHPFWLCPRCGEPVIYSGSDPRGFTHAENCPVVEARQLLGWPTDERGNLVEER